VAPFQPLGRSEPPRGACGAARHLRSSSVLVEGSDSSRCRDQLRGIRLLTVVAFTRSRTGAARRSPAGIYRWPPTSCAHRLRKPDPTCELLAPSVALRNRDCGLLPAPPSTLSGGPLPCRLPRGAPRRDDFRRARSAVTAVGLGRRTTNEPEHLPSDRPGPCGPSGLGHACCSRAWLRPAPCHLPRSRAGLVKDWLVASNYPVSPRERCASPTSATDSTTRAPCGLLDSRPRPVQRDASRRPARSSTSSPWAYGHTATRLGPRLRLPDEPTRWSFA
jgi:hypothetical protein